MNISPEQIRQDLWVFYPSNSQQGSWAWWLDCYPEPVLIDCPPVNRQSINSLKSLSNHKKTRILLTNRDGHGSVNQLHDELGWPVLVQEQEAYLLPGIKDLQTFEDEHITSSGIRLLWTPGHSPGSCVVYAPLPWNVLFCGRLLSPTKSCQFEPLRKRTTFHWSRQQKSLQKLRAWISPDTMPSLGSGVSLEVLGSQKLGSWDQWKES